MRTSEALGRGVMVKKKRKPLVAWAVVCVKHTPWIECPSRLPNWYRPNAVLDKHSLAIRQSFIDPDRCRFKVIRLEAKK